jgi:predicted RNase H-like HicB family nuclease
MSIAEKKETGIVLRAVIYREGKWWIAHCLELDLVAEGDSAREAMDNLIDIANTQIEVALQDGNLESILTPAPAKMWTLYFDASADEFPVKKTKRQPNRIERFEARELTFA